MTHCSTTTQSKRLASAAGACATATRLSARRPEKITTFCSVNASITLQVHKRNKNALQYLIYIPLDAMACLIFQEYTAIGALTVLRRKNGVNILRLISSRASRATVTATRTSVTTTRMSMPKACRLIFTASTRAAACAKSVRILPPVSTATPALMAISDRSGCCPTTRSLAFVCDGLCAKFAEHHAYNLIFMNAACQCGEDHRYTGNCEAESGKCECKEAFRGAHDCTACADGYYDYPDCKPCDCFSNGTV